LEDLSRFPAAARRKAGFQLFLVQEGDEPDDWKPMAEIGPAYRKSGFARKTERSV
jgi:phage-related protein